MKSIPVLMLIVLGLASSCGQKTKENADHGSMHGDAPGENQALYNEVMNIHDEVMPKMDDIYKLEQALKKQLTVPEISPDKKKALESTIMKLDSAGEGMMVWMRNFNPIPDSLGEEKARQYLMDEKTKITRVKDNMLQAIDQAQRFQ